MQKTTPISLKNTICSSGIRAQTKHVSTTFGEHPGRTSASDQSTPPLSVNIFMDKILYRKPRCTQTTPDSQVFQIRGDLSQEVHYSHLRFTCLQKSWGFPLSSSLLVMPYVCAWLVAVSRAQGGRSDEVSLLLWLLSQPAPGIWPCVMGTHYYVLCPKCVCSSLMSQEPNSLSVLWV